MNAVFLDTGYVLALELSNDENHTAARTHWLSVQAALPRIVTTSSVFSEIVTFFNRKRRHDKAVEIGRMLRESPSVELIHVDRPLFDDAWGLLLSRNDKTWSLTDCISFEIMKRRGLQAAFTFDRHFEQAGFQRLPRIS